MLDKDTRAAILRLAQAGHGIKPIARTLKVSRQAVREVLRSRSSQVPVIRREQKAQQHLDTIRQLFTSCERNRVRVQEELVAKGIDLSYSTLTRFCRQQGIGLEPKPYAGAYTFAPGQEMQHDTSPHTVNVGGSRRKLQCASLVLCYSRMIYAQLFPTFDRFWCKVFLTDALGFFGGAAARCLVDNTHVVVASGTGKNAVMAPEMAAFADRFDFVFAAHEVGDADRSGRVERPFDYIEGNFYPGRTFEDLPDLNRQLLDWCRRVGARYKKHIRAIPAELFQAERPHLRPLPIHVPQVQRIHQRTVDVEGYVNLHTNRYSVPEGFLSRPVQVRETKDKISIFLGHKLVAEHDRRQDGAAERVTLPEHRHASRWNRKGNPTLPIPEENALRAAGRELCALVELLKKKHGGRAARAIKHLYKLYLDYPTELLASAAGEAVGYGLSDLERIERMVIRKAAGEFFRLQENDPPGPEENHG